MAGDWVCGAVVFTGGIKGTRSGPQAQSGAMPRKQGVVTGLLEWKAMSVRGLAKDVWDIGKEQV